MPVDQVPRNVIPLRMRRCGTAEQVDQCVFHRVRTQHRGRCIAARRIVRLQTDARTEHQRIVLVDLVIEPRIETMVVVTRIANPQRIVILGGVVAQIIVAVRNGIHMGFGRIEEIAAVKLHFFAPLFGIVDSQRIHGRNAALVAHHEIRHLPTAPVTRAASAAIRGADYAENVVDGEILLVHVISHADNRKPALVVEQVQARPGIVLVVEPITRIELAESPAVHIFPRNQVDRFVTFPVIHSAEFCLVAEFVEHLDFIDRLGRQVLDRSGHVAAEELLAVHQDFLHRFAVRGYRTVLHTDARHLFEQVFGRSVLRYLKGSGIVNDGIAFGRSAHRPC